MDFFLDIETVPDFEPEQYLDMHKREEAGLFTKAHSSYWKYKLGALSPFEGRVILVTYQAGSAPPVRLKEWERGEQAILRDLYGVVADLQRNGGRLNIVGHNVLSFDIPFLYQRMLARSVNEPKWVHHYMVRKPAVADLLQLHLPVNGYSAKGLKHDVLARAYGLETKATSGADEVLHYFEERYDLILEYSEREFVYPEMFARMRRDGIATAEKIRESVEQYERNLG